MFISIVIALLVSVGLIFIIFSSRANSPRDNSRLSAFANHPECFVRVTDKTNYTVLEEKFDPSAPDFQENVKDSLEMRIYDIRSALYNFPKEILGEYKDLLAFPNDIYELFCLMQGHDSGSHEPVYIYKGDPEERSLDSNFMCVSSYCFNTGSTDLFTTRGVISPDRAQSMVKHFINEISMQELLDTAKMYGKALVGNSKEELFKSAYDNGLLKKMQTDGDTSVAYRVTGKYFEMETLFFQAYAADIEKNLAGANRLYVDKIIAQACKVNIFSKARPNNRLTAMLQRLR